MFWKGKPIAGWAFDFYYFSTLLYLSVVMNGQKYVEENIIHRKLTLLHPSYTSLIFLFHGLKTPSVLVDTIHIFKGQ